MESAFPRAAVIGVGKDGSAAARQLLSGGIDVNVSVEVDTERDPINYPDKRGLIEPDFLGITLPHEHLLTDLMCYFAEPVEASEKKMAHEPGKGKLTPP